MSDSSTPDQPPSSPDPDDVPESITEVSDDGVSAAAPLAPPPDEQSPTDAPAPATRRPLILVGTGLIAALVVGLLAWMAVSGGDDGDGLAVPADTPGASVAGCETWDALRPSTRARSTDDRALAEDGRVATGTLDNGIEFFVRENSLPGSSATLALTIAAGSAFEDDDQLGGAHFLEHMLFNGTTEYPKNELKAALARLGVQIGGDLNAYTSFDETVYYFDLPNDEQSLALGLDVLREWTTNATILEADVVEERGVILEELRSRQNPQQRFFQRISDLILGGTAYEQRSPIGTSESISSMTAADLRRFYEDWYRPDLMSITAVGEFDSAFVADEIERRFSDIPVAAEPRTPLALTEAEFEPRLLEFIDDEVQATSVEVVFTTPATPITTRGDVRRQMARDVAVLAIAERLGRAANDEATPFYDADVYDVPFVRSFDSLLVSVDAEAALLAETLGHTLTALADLRRDGLLDAELRRAIDTRRSTASASVAAGASTQDNAYTFRFIDRYLVGTATIEEAPLARIELGVLEDLTLAEVNDAIVAATACESIAIHGGAPSSFGDVLPDEEATVLISAAVERTADDVPPLGPTPDRLMPEPDSVSPIGSAATQLYGEGRRIEYPNGATVVIVPSPIEAGTVYLTAESPGGLALIADQDVVQARTAGHIVGDSGVGDFDRLTTEAFAQAHSIQVDLSIADAHDEVSAAAPTAEVDAMLQLVHQRMTAPRADTGAIAQYRGETELSALDPFGTAELALQSAFEEAFFNGDPRYRSLPTPEELDELDADRMVDMIGARFGDVGDFDFVIVGDLDINTIAKLADRYIGSLPGNPALVEVVPDIRPIAATTPEKEVVRAGDNDQATVRVAFDVDVSQADLLSGRVRHHAAVLASVVGDALFDRLREGLGATYSPVASAEVRQRPDIGLTITIDVQTEPARVDEVSSEIRSVLAELRATGAEADDLSQALEPLVRDSGFQSNRQIISDWFLGLQRPEIAVSGLQIGASAWYSDIDGSLIQRLANEFLPNDRSVEIQILPEG